MTSLRALLFTLVSAGAVALCVLGAASAGGKILAERAVLRGMTAKDVTADVLPPPLYLIELRLLLSLAADNSLDPATARAEQARLVKEYRERVAHWTQNPPHGLEAELLGPQHAAAQRFIAASEQVLAAAGSGNREAIDAAVKQAHAEYLEHRRGVDATVKSANAFTAGALADYEATQQATLWLLVVVFLLATVSLVALGAWVSRSVLRSTGGEPAEVARIANAVAQGDLTVRVAVAQGDHSSVMAAMARMCQNLREMVTSVGSCSEAIATGSQQIANDNLELSVRTEQQAANLQQSASAMEEFSGTVNTSADTAAEATTMALSASAVAQRGAQVVSDVVSTMQEISMSSQRIREITSVIDGIAFQTNILALNAAVEAARAGEQGRGFAVVASEVRSLAQRSATAAKEINALIGQSVVRVQTGTQLVADAGATMGDIVDQVKHVAELIGEISSATREQTQGIGLVSTAITQLDSATQRNAAMVEESAAAAGNLKDQAAELVRSVRFFKVQTV